MSTEMALKGSHSAPSGMSDEERKGFVAALAAFGMWGLLPLFWALLRHIAPYEQLSHRMVWAMVALAVLLAVTGRMQAFLDIVRNKKILLRLCASTVCISANWYLFLYAVAQNRVLDSSLGYYVTPLMSTLLGYALFKERFSRLQGIGIGCAALGVLWSLVSYAEPPVLALALALTFSLYGLIRKVTPVDPLCALFIETLLMTPFALFVLGYIYTHGQPIPTPSTLFICMLGGLVTLFPLLCFGYAAQHVRLTVLGLSQYVAPTLSFFVSIFVFHEPFTARALVTFACIWLGLSLYSLASWRSAHPVHRVSRKK